MAAVLLVSVVVGRGPDLASASGCTLRQLTDSLVPDEDGYPGFEGLTMDGGGQRVAFMSDRDLTDANPGRQWVIFVVDAATAEVTQLSTAAQGAWEPNLTADGRRLSFVSRRNLTGQNADGDTEIYLRNLSTGVVRQVTDTTHGDIAVTQGAVVAANSSPAMSRDGGRMAYITTTDPDMRSPGGTRLWWSRWVDRRTGRSVELPTSSWDEYPSLDGDGTKVAYVTAGRVEVRDVGTNTTSVLTHRPGRFYEPAISGDGSRVAFYSTADLVHDKPHRGYEIFVHDLGAGTTAQVTSSVGLPIDDLRPSNDGTRLVFTSRGDLAGENPARVEQVFVRDLSDGTIDQVSPTGPAFEPATDDQATRIAFVSSADLVGRNADGNYEIFLADCPSPAPRVRHQADVRVRGAQPGPLLGDDRYGGDGAGQIRLSTRPPGSVARFVASVQNDGDAPDTFRIRGRATPPGLEVTYWDGDADVTTSVRNGTYQVGPLAPGAARDLEVEVRVTDDARRGSAPLVWVRAMPVGNDPRVDVGGARYEVR